MDKEYSNTLSRIKSIISEHQLAADELITKILGHVDNGVILTNNNNQILWMNIIAERSFDIEQTNFENQEINNLFEQCTEHSNNEINIEALTNKYRNTQTPIELKIQLKQQEESSWFEFKYITANTINIYFFKDISNLKRLENLQKPQITQYSHSVDHLSAGNENISQQFTSTGHTTEYGQNHSIDENNIKKFTSLTRQQNTVMEYLIEGKTNKIIGQLMGISPRTVEKHRALVMQKLDVNNIPDLVKLALSNNVGLK